jgi:hypothetical protein
VQALLSWVGGAVLLGLVTVWITAVVLIAAARKVEPNAKLQSELRALENDFADLTDHITRKESRERVRKMRDGREAAAPAIPPLGTAEHKEYLRRLARERGVMR